MAIDPICGMTVSEGSALSAEKDGRTFFFCCETCRRKFIDPTAIPHQSPRATPSLPFFCPMCEGVESDKPGLCPTCGMALESASPGAEEDTTELDDMTHRLRWGLLFAIPVFIIAMGPMLIPGMGHGPESKWLQWLEALLSAPVVLWAGAPFFQRAWTSLKTARLNMFTLIGMGTGTAFTYSLFAFLSPGLFPDSFRHHGLVPVYFESASTIIVLVLLGQVMELRARRKTGTAIRELLKLAPTVASRVVDGHDEEVPLAAVHPGDVLRVRPGGKIPVDGILLDGSGMIDASLLTGESEPVEVTAGLPVAAGTVAVAGSFLMRADKVGADTLFARIIALTADAQRSRAPIQHAADRAAAVFVPLVGGAALLTFIVWALVGPEPRAVFALINAVSVLIIACPCALGLAVPMAIMVGMGRGARAGILIRDAEVVERLRSVDTLVTDKTGTLTEGKPRVTGIQPEPGYTEVGLLQWAAAVEIHSEHPLGKAIVQHARDRGVTFSSASEFTAMAGGGVTGIVDNQRISVGRPDTKQSTTGATGGQSLVVIRASDRIIGTVTLSDPIRQSAANAVQLLRHMHLDVIMLTGDQESTATAVANQLGIKTVHAGVTPAGKLEIIRKLKSAGHRVAMAGDGINDAPALAEADVGIAMGTGTDVAMESAGVILVKGDLEGIAGAIRLSRGVMRNIRQNLIWAFAYNLAGIPLAAGILYPPFGLLLNPMVAAGAMSLSSFSVITNALRLRRLPLRPHRKIKRNCP